MQIISFQEPIAVSGTAQNPPNNPIVRSVTISAPSANSAATVLGNASTVTTATGFLLEKGDSVTVELPGGNTNALWAVGTAGDGFSVVGA
jgi:hypothetical protein